VPNLLPPKAPNALVVDAGCPKTEVLGAAVVVAGCPNAPVAAPPKAPVPPPLNAPNPVAGFSAPKAPVDAFALLPPKVPAKKSE